MNRMTMGALALLLGLALPAGRAGAAEIKVLSTGNMQSILGALTADFEGATGHKLVIEYGSTPKMKSRVEAGDAADLTINERYVLDDLLKQGRVEAGTLIDLARSPIGIGVPHRRAQARHQLGRGLQARAARGRQHRLSGSERRRAGRRLLLRPHHAHGHRRRAQAEDQADAGRRRRRQGGRRPAPPRSASRRSATSTRSRASSCWSRCPTFRASSS